MIRTFDSIIRMKHENVNIVVEINTFLFLFEAILRQLCLRDCRIVQKTFQTDTKDFFFVYHRKIYIERYVHFSHY